MDSMDLLPPVSVRPVAFCCCFLVFLFAAQLLHSFPAVAAAAQLSNETDRLTLLRFKDEIIEDPFGASTSWSHTRHFCKWQGVVCGRHHPERVTALNLRSCNLVGRRISPHISNLTFLTRVDLANNTFDVVIPAEIGRLYRLRYLEVNRLQGNLPPNLFLKLANLTWFSV
ncbi:hypothetical protein ACLOJK_022488 [Asimina triloba]